MRISSILTLIGVVLLCVVNLTISALAQSEESERLLIMYDPMMKDQLLDELAEQGAVVRHDFDDINTLAVAIPTTFRRSGTKLGGATAVAIDAPVSLMQLDEPDESESFQQIPWGITLSGAPNVWHVGDGSGVRVCIIDTGLDRTHEDIQYNNIIGGYNGVEGEAWFDDRNFHGTAMVGVINATNNKAGLVGVAPGNVELLIADTFSNISNGGDASESDILKAAEWCRDNGANIINMSLGTIQFSGGFLGNGFRQIYNSGVLMVAASGNYGVDSGTTDWNTYPASYDSVISVGGVGFTLTHSFISQENDQVELSAPGVKVYTTANDPEVVILDGQVLSANVIFNADAFGTYSATVVSGGSCNDPVAAGTYTDLIVLCERGTATFRTKIDNVADGGGIAAVIYNNTRDPDTGALIPYSQNIYGTYSDPCCAEIPSVTLNRNDGLMLLDNVGQEITIEIGGDNYISSSGTSFAAPHVAGGAAILWSACPSLTNDQIRAHLAYFANDLGESGRDISYGYGFITIDYALYALFDGVDTYTQFNTNGNSPANVECSTDPPVNITPTATHTSIPPTATNTPLPTNTPLIPTDTPSPTNTPLIPTDTPLPTNTPFIPTNTPAPTNTPIIPTNTPPATAVPVVLTNTPPIILTNTPIPPVNTPVPPTEIPSGTTVIYNSDFEGATNWLINPNGTDSATDGFWTLGDPYTTGTAGAMQVENTYSGMQGMFTGLLGGNIGANDIDDGITSFQSPAIPLPADKEAMLSFAYYLAFTNGTVDDMFRVSVVQLDGTDVLLEETAAEVNKVAEWKTAQFSLNKYAGDDVQLLVEAADLGTGSVIEAGFDAVEISIQGTVDAIPLNVTVDYVDANETGWTAVFILMLVVGCAAVTVRLRIDS